MSRAKHIRPPIDPASSGRRRPEGFGLGMLVAGGALLGSAALSLVVLVRIHEWGGPNLLKRVPADLVLLRLVLTTPLPLIAAIAIGYLPSSRRFTATWMGITAALIALNLPGLIRHHPGGAAFVAIALGANVIGLLVATGKRFRDTCTRLQRNG